MIDNIDEHMVDDKTAGYDISPSIKEKLQQKIQDLQQSTQPKYIEKVHYVCVNSFDRDWINSSENRYSYQVKFNQNSTYTGASINNIYRNIISVEPVIAILPLDAHIEAFDSRLYFNISKYPYLLLRIDELDGVFRGTNNSTDKAFSTLIYDKMYFTEVLSSGYSTSPASGGIVNSSPALSFSNEFRRGYIKYNPAYFEKKKFYNNPLASLTKMTISITDHRGYTFNTFSDVLSVSAIALTAVLGGAGGLTATDFEISPAGAGFPRTNYNTEKMLKITTTTYFSNRLFRIGDRIVIQNYSITGGTNSTQFTAFINRPEGHIIINLDVEQVSAGATNNTNNKGYFNALYISPPGSINTASGNSTGYYEFDGTTASYTNCKLINTELQTNIMFRIVTRDADTSNSTIPIN